jgi:hypothetical protein
VKILIMETEKTAQKINLHRNARKGILEVDDPARRQAKLMRFKERLKKERVRSRAFAAD